MRTPIFYPLQNSMRKLKELRRASRPPSLALQTGISTKVSTFKACRSSEVAAQQLIYVLLR